MVVQQQWRKQQWCLQKLKVWFLLCSVALMRRTAAAQKFVTTPCGSSCHCCVEHSHSLRAQFFYSSLEWFVLLPCSAVIFSWCAQLLPLLLPCCYQTAYMESHLYIYKANLNPAYRKGFKVWPSILFYDSLIHEAILCILLLQYFS